MKKILFGSRIFTPELIIFDKDGTLVDFESTWVPLLDMRVQQILDRLGAGFQKKTIREELYSSVGVSPDSIDPHGPFPQTSTAEDEVIAAAVLYRHGIPWQRARKIVRESLIEAEKALDRPKYAKLLPGTREVLVSLRNHGIHLAVATADLTDITNAILKRLDIDGLFDIVIGADSVRRDKPDPEMIETAISRVGATPERVAFVGDTVNDMEMGRRSGIGLVVGVLEGGVTPREDLEELADLVIDSVRDIRAADR